MDSLRTSKPDPELIKNLRSIEGYRGLSIHDENLQETHHDGDIGAQTQELVLKHSAALFDIDASSLGLTGPSVIVLNRADEKILMSRSEGKTILLTISREAKVGSFIDSLIKP